MGGGKKLSHIEEGGGGIQSVEVFTYGRQDGRYILKVYDMGGQPTTTKSVQPILMPILTPTF